MLSRGFCCHSLELGASALASFPIHIFMAIELLKTLPANTCFANPLPPSGFFIWHLLSEVYTITLFKMQSPQIPFSPHPVLFSLFHVLNDLLKLYNFFFLLYISIETRLFYFAHRCIPIFRVPGTVSDTQSVFKNI